MSLSGITGNEDIEDARFLDELREVFDSFETFTSACEQIEMALQNSGRNLKERIKNEFWLSNYKCTSVGKKFGSCFSKYNVFYFPPPPTSFIPTSPIINFRNIFHSPRRPFIPTPPFIRHYWVINLVLNTTPPPPPPPFSSPKFSENSLHKKWNFSLKISSFMWPNPEET